MRPRCLLCLVSLAAIPALAPAACIPLDQAAHKVGATTCVTGKVVKVDQSNPSVFFLDFCEDYRRCPFTVVVFPRHLRDVGDIRQLKGKDVEIHGEIQQWMGRAEIVLKDARQLHGGVLPPVPKNYDVSHHGNYSPGQFKRATPAKRTSPKQKKGVGPDELGVDTLADAQH